MAKNNYNNKKLKFEKKIHSRRSKINSMSDAWHTVITPEAHRAVFDRRANFDIELRQVLSVVPGPLLQGFCQSHWN